jgi:thiamine-phosphate pyrophosphorylase
LADSLARAQLARAADALRRRSQSSLPALVLLTDDDRLPDPRPVIAALPRGSLVVLRARDRERRMALANLLARLARERGLVWTIADDPELAWRMGADGAHFPESKIALAARWRVRRPEWLITCAAHSLRACLLARQASANAVLLSPIFPTASHPGRAGLGELRARSIARLVPLPVYALGGVDGASARQLATSPLVGLASIGGLAVQ